MAFGRVPRLGLAFFLSLFSSSFFLVEPVPASSFSVDPIRVFLTAKTPSGLLTLRNSSQETLRFQLEVFAWDQDRGGQMRLNPTEDIIFFPVLLSLHPGEERKVRVGTVTPDTSRERAYRIFVNELPPRDQAEGNQIRILTKMGIPIFLQPAQQQSSGYIRDMAIRDGVFSFRVVNGGNVHFLAQKVRVRGIGSEGEVLLESEMDGWYVLAGSLRDYKLTLPREDCASIKTLAVEVDTGETALKESFALESDSCR